VILAIVFVLSFAVELWCALPNGLATHFYGLPATTPASSLIPQLGASDAGSYLGAALDLQDGMITSEYLWVLNLWPPGMPLILAVMIKLGGGASPVIPMVVLICLLWSTVLTVMASVCMKHRGYISFAAFTVIWLISPVFTAWTIHSGVLGSDGLATAIGALVAIGLMHIATSPPPARVRWLLHAGLGIGFAALAHLRIMWFYAVPAALLVVVILVVARMSYRWLAKKPNTPHDERKAYLGWLVLFATFVALCTPWTVIGAVKLHPGNLSWSQGDYQFAQLWMPDDDLKEIGGSFLVTGGANWPCQIAEDQCAQIAREERAATHPYGGDPPNTFTHLRNEAFAVALTHPGEFVANRSAVTIGAWLSTPGGAVGSFNNVGFGAATLLAFFAALGTLIYRSRRSAAALCLFLLLGANMAILWLTHFETRYLVPLQAISMVVVVFAALPLEQRFWSRATRSARPVEREEMEIPG
jgi:hypothetical protein